MTTYYVNEDKPTNKATIHQCDCLHILERLNQPPKDPKHGRWYGLQHQEERDAFDDATNCILCCSCYSACPVIEGNPDFLGPAAIAQAFRFLEDTRDKGFKDRLSVLDNPNGVWACENHFECTRVCPRGIKITKHINHTKRRIKSSHEGEG